MIEAVPYTGDFKSNWNEFAKASKNATFLLDRNYMDYHSERFKDCSLLFFDKSKLTGLLPANISGKMVYSHEGLTYGSLLVKKDSGYEQIQAMLDTARCYYSDYLDATAFYYKPIPYIYHRYPAQEDLYWLFRQGAQLTARSLSSAIELPCAPAFSSLRKRHASKARKNGLSVSEVTDDDQWRSYWDILSSVLLTRHGCTPVHSSDEILLLKHRFANIRLFCAWKEAQMLAGCVAYLTDSTIHIQYIAANEEGRLYGALDYLFQHMLSLPICNSRRYFDFGISTEQGGKFLNSGLLFQKEGFGARGICYDQYCLKLK